MHRFLVVIEKGENNYSAYSADLPGCVATGSTREEVGRNMHEAIIMHVEGLREDNLPIPDSDAFAEYMAVSALRAIMNAEKYIYWQDGSTWLGYLEEYPDYWTQGQTEEELRDNLIDIYKELKSGAIPNVRRRADLEVA